MTRPQLGPLRNRASFYYDLLVILPTVLITYLSFGVFFMSFEVGEAGLHLQVILCTFQLIGNQTILGGSTVCRYTQMSNIVTNV